MDKKKLREFALRVLDDENGIRADACSLLTLLLTENGSGDLANAIDITEDRAYIGEDIAEECLEQLDEWEEANREDPTCDDCAPEEIETEDTPE